MYFLPLKKGMARWNGQSTIVFIIIIVIHAPGTCGTFSSIDEKGCIAFPHKEHQLFKLYTLGTLDVCEEVFTFFTSDL